MSIEIEIFKNFRWKETTKKTSIIDKIIKINY